MTTDIKQVQVKQATSGRLSVIGFLRNRPTEGYFILAYGFAWLWEIPMFGLSHKWFAGPWLILSPTLAAFVMAWITEGKVGMSGLLRRCLAWRAGLQWYLIAVLSIPALFITSLILMAGGFK